MTDHRADLHVHSEFSWDADEGSMETTCRRAAGIGLPAIAFTEHADFTPWTTDRAQYRPGVRVVETPRTNGSFDVESYWECVERCRGLFPDLRIRTGVELGQPHRFPTESARLLACRPFDVVLGSVHCIPRGELLVDVTEPGMLDVGVAEEHMRTYLAEVLDLIEAPVFGTLAHIDYPKRDWPHGSLAYTELAFEEEFRALLAAAATADLSLELNTSGGAVTCPGPLILAWWREAGGRALSLGSDAHDPETIAAGFEESARLAEAAGFRPPADPGGLWVRSVSR